MENRRKKPRAKTREKVIVVQLRYAGINSPEEQKTLFSTTADISKQGAQFTLDRKMERETPIRVTIIFKDPPHHFEHVGQVRWQQPLESGDYLTGIEFLPAKHGASHAWEAFLESSFPYVGKKVLDSKQVG